MKRMLAALLALTLLLPAFLTSCSEKNPETAPEQSTAPVASDIPGSEPAEEEEETRPPHNLPEMDFGGAAFRISAYDGNTSVPTLQPEELNGEAVNDAIFNRNTMLTETYNFVFDTIPYGTDYNGHTRDIMNMVRAGDDAYEMIYGHVVGTCNNAINGDYMNLYELPYIDFSAIWWPAQSVDEMTVFGRMFTITGSATYSQLAAAKVVFFNKGLAEQFSLPNPYDDVRSGDWTIDALIGYTKDLYQDTNGDGKRDPGDLFGYCENWLAFQQRFMELLPAIPVYSNVYFDFFPQVLHDYVINANISWPQAINAAFLDEYVEEELPEGEEEEFID